MTTTSWFLHRQSSKNKIKMAIKALNKNVIYQSRQLIGIHGCHLHFALFSVVVTICFFSHIPSDSSQQWSFTHSGYCLKLKPKKATTLICFFVSKFAITYTNLAWRKGKKKSKQRCDLYEFWLNCKRAWHSMLCYSLRHCIVNQIYIIRHHFLSKREKKKKAKTKLNTSTQIS